MLQRAMHVHTDKVVVVLPFLPIRSYRDALCRQLGIPPFSGREVRTEKEFKSAVQEMVEYVIRESGRPAYFSPGSQEAVSGMARKLYNEGLVYRYSEEPYDNVSAAKRHVERIIISIPDRTCFPFGVMVVGKRDVAAELHGHVGAIGTII